MKTLKVPQVLGLTFVLLSVGCLSYATVVARGPDVDLTFVRDVPTKLTPDYLDKVIREVPRWPDWFYLGSKANQIDFRGMPYPLQDQRLVQGGMIEMLFDPHRLERDRFTLKYQVLDYVPRQKMTIRVVFDSKEALTKLFDRIDWTIEFLPNPYGGEEKTMIRGIETVHTAHWRARLFGKLVPSIFLNQIFYPNLLTLSAINNPDTVHPFPPDNG